jgi:hypothetical protein
MGAVTAANVAGRTPDDFKIVNENFDQNVAGNMAEGGSSPASPRSAPTTRASPRPRSAR